MKSQIHAHIQSLKLALSYLSPKHRKWRQLLDSLNLDPAELPKPLETIGQNNFIICGAPRTGTTLASAMLFQPPQVVTVMEPWDGMRLSPIALFRSLRQELDETRTLQRGKLDIAALQHDGQVVWMREGQSNTSLHLDRNYRLGVKWPAFWRYLPLLPESKFLVCLRHPVETIASYKKKGGQLGQGLEYDIVFNRDLNRRLRSATVSDALRRILLYQSINQALLPYLSEPNVFIIRYERWFLEPEQLLAEIGDFLGVTVSAMPATIQHTDNPIRLDKDELALINKHCDVASQLGYVL